MFFKIHVDAPNGDLTLLAKTTPAGGVFQTHVNENPAPNPSTSICIHIYLYMYTCTCMGIKISLSLSLSLSLSIYIYIYYVYVRKMSLALFQFLPIPKPFVYTEPGMSSNRCLSWAAKGLRRPAGHLASHRDWAQPWLYR